jgi:uncharacterized protein YndB with AHSA1/START domain
MTSEKRSPEVSAAEATRSATYEIRIDATPAVVWRALTDPQEIERWFALTARVTPGPDGHYSLRWRDRHTGDDWPILIWDPERHLAIGMHKPSGAPAPTHVVTDFVLDAIGGQTILRVVASGFDAGAPWDAFFDGVRRGWRFELGSLKHYLERHRGERRTVAWAFARTRRSAEAIWPTLFGRGGWSSARALDELRAGDHYALTAPDATALSGAVTILDRPTDFTGTVKEFNDGFLRVQLEAERDGVSVTVWLAAYGVDLARMAALEKTWQLAVERCVSG